MKIVCGVDISGNVANIVLLKGKKTEYSIVQSEFKKIKLEDEKNQSHVKSFHQVMENFLKQNQVIKMSVKRPSTSGKFQAGPVAFKIETILQLSAVPIELLHATKISSLIKKSIISDETYEEIHKYQRAAFEAAFSGLED